jgi:hypothetical protein
MKRLVGIVLIIIGILILANLFSCGKDNVVEGLTFNPGEGYNINYMNMVNNENWNDGKWYRGTCLPPSSTSYYVDEQRLFKQI